MARNSPFPLLSLRVVLRKGTAFGPGKADLLEHIRATGSIAAAGRRMKMSYTRAWGLVRDMNDDFASPLVRSAKGGSARGGAELTELGVDVLERYRHMQSATRRAAASDLKALIAKLR
jgi:molybdate transport system regulatory protein